MMLVKPTRKLPMMSKATVGAAAIRARGSATAQSIRTIKLLSQRHDENQAKCVPKQTQHEDQSNLVDRDCKATSHNGQQRLRIDQVGSRKSAGSCHDSDGGFARCPPGSLVESRFCEHVLLFSYKCSYS